MKEAFKIGAIEAERAKTTLTRLQCSEYADGTPLTIPLVVVHGADPGPVLFLKGCQHGDEVIGALIAREVAATVDPTALRGTLLIVPIANVPAFLTRSRGFSLEERGPLNMGYSFPGNKNGPLTDRIAYTLFHEVVLRSNYVIDLHAGLTGAVIYPFTYVVPSDNKYGTLEAREGIAKASGLPYVFRVSRERASHFFFRPGPGDYDVTFGGQCDQKKIPRVLVEMGEGGKITDEFVPVGIKAISNILKHLKMLPGKPELLLGKQRVFENYKQVRANRGGTLWMQMKVNAQVKKGDLLGRIYGPLDVMEEIVSPIDGVVLRVMTNAIVYPGAEVAWIIEVEKGA
jgi:hypothetical protein